MVAKLLTGLGYRRHRQRGHRHRLGLHHPLNQRFAVPIAVHQKADTAAIDPVNRDHPVIIQHLVQHMQQETVTAHHHQGIGLLRLHPVMFAGHCVAGRTRNVRFRSHQRQPPVHAHYPLLLRPASVVVFLHAMHKPRTEQIKL